MLDRIPPKTIRCKWYDDDGNPVLGGCKRESMCDYAHPREREWSVAVRKYIATDRPPPRRGTERAGTPPALRLRRAELSKRSEPSRSFNRRDDRRKEFSDFDEASWNVPVSKGKAPERSYSWGTSSSSARRDSRPEKSASFNAGPSKGDGKKDDNGWASASGWGSSSGWGDDGAWGDDGGWGNSGWGEMNSSGSKESKNSAATSAGDRSGTAQSTGGGVWGASSSRSAGESSGTKEPKDKDGTNLAGRSGTTQSKDAGGWGAGWSTGWGSPNAGSGFGGGWGEGVNSPQGSPSSPSTATAHSAQDTAKSDLATRKPSVAPQPAKKPVTFSFGHSRNSSMDSQPTPDPRKVSFAIPALPAKTPTEGKGKEHAVERPTDLTIDTQFAARSERARYSSAGGTPHDPRRAGTSVSNLNTPAVGPPLAAPSSSRTVMPPPPSSAAFTTSMSKELLTAAKAIKRRATTDNMKPKISILQANLTPEERAIVYQKTIRHVQELVCLQIKLNKAKSYEQAWKRSQSSHYYSNSSQLSREKLTTGREEAVRRAQELRKQRDGIIKDLTSLPDIPTKPYRPYNVTADRQKLINYTLELKKWMEDLDLPRRVAALQIKEAQTPKPEDNAMKASVSGAESLNDEPFDPMAVDSNSDAGEELRVADELRAKPRITVADIGEAVKRLEDRVGKAWELAALEAFTQDEMDEMVNDLRDKFTEKLKKQNLKATRAQKLKLEAAMEGQTEARNALAKALEDKLVLGEVVNERINGVQTTVDELKQKTAEIEKLNDELEIQIVAAEQQQQERTELVTTLSNEIRALAARRARAAPRRVRQYTVDDIPLAFRQSIINELVNELQPVLQGFLAGTSHAGEELKTALEKMIEPLIQKTAVITKAVKSVTAPS